MNDYEKLENLNDLADQMLGSIDNYSEHLLYQNNKFLDIAKQMSPLIKSLRDPKKKFPVSDEQRKKVLDRATRLQVFFKAVKETKEKMDKLDKAGMYSSNDAMKNDAIAYEYMLKMKLAVADINDHARSTTGRFSDGIKTKNLNDIFNANIKDSKIDIRTGYMGVMSNLFLRNENSANRLKARQALRNGTIQQHLAIDVLDQDVYTRFEINPIDTVKELAESKSVQEVIKRYQEAEKFWLGSGLTDAEERASRRAFMETYSDELNGLYQALNVDTVPHANDVRTDIINYLNSKGLSGMMRDYSNMMMDRNNVFEKHEPWSYLFTPAAGMKEEEVEFRAIPTKNPVYDYKSAEPNAAQKEGLKEFHKWIYRHCDNKSLGEAFGANGSAREFMEDFIKAPYETQIKTLYLLETKSRRNGPIPDENSEEFKNYVPNFKKIKDVMLSSKFKFWQRLNGKKHRWNKVKECMDRINSNTTPEKRKSQPWTDGTLTGRTMANLVSGPANFVDKYTKATESSTTTKISTVAGDALGAVQGVMAIGKAIKELKSNKTHTAGEITGLVVDAGQGLANVVRSGASSYTKLIDANNKLAGNIALHTGGVLNGVLATRAAIDNRKLKGRNKAFDKGINKVIQANENKEFDNDKKNELLGKIKKHGNVLKKDNDTKALGRGIDFLSSGANFVGYLFTAFTHFSIAMPATLAVTSVAAPIIMAIKNKLAIKGDRKTIDAKMYANDAEKEKAINDLRKNIDKRINRLPNNKAYDGQRKELEKLKKSKTRLLHHIRKNEARKNGCVNEKQLKKLYVDNIEKEAKEMYNMDRGDNERQHNLADLAKAGAEKLLNLAGKKVPERPQNQVAEQPAEENVAENNQRNARGI